MTIGNFAAESQAKINSSKDPMLAGFSAGKYFEIEDFDLDVGLEDEDTSEQKVQEENEKAQRRWEDQQRYRASAGNSGSRFDAARDMPPEPKQAVKKTKKFDKWLSSGKVPADKNGRSIYPLDFQAFSFTRQLDKASMAMFNACCNAQSIPSAILVKRKPIGVTQRSITTGTAVAHMGYFRIEFTDILIISLNWDVSDVIKEKVKFICRAAKVKYRPQLPSGDLGAEVGGAWKALLEDKG